MEWTKGRQFQVRRPRADEPGAQLQRDGSVRPAQLYGTARRQDGNHWPVVLPLEAGQIITCAGRRSLPWRDGSASLVFFVDPRPATTDEIVTLAFWPTIGPDLAPEPHPAYLQPLNDSAV